MRAIVWLALGLVAAAAPALAQGPAGSTCNVQIDSSRRSRYVQAPGGGYDTYAGGGIWAHCREQPTTMYSDSVAWFPERDLLFLVGHVRFQDSVSRLTADRVTYYLQQERLYAEGNVYTKNLHTGSDLHGPNLDYYRVAPPIRDTSESFARQRPTIHFYSSTAPRGAAADSVEPFVVVADRVKMRGDDQMWGGGNLTINRSDLAAAGDSGQLDLGRNVGTLLGQPQVNGTGRDAYHLNGDRITFRLTPAHEIQHVLSSGQAVAHGVDWRLKADTIDLTLDSSKVQLAEAWGRNQRADAVSGPHTIVADSLDIHMPAQLVRLVWAYGHARTTTRDTTVRDTTGLYAAARDTTPRDTTARRDSALARANGVRRDSTLGRADGERRDSALVRADEDWMTGDTLRADFAVVQDSAGGKPSSELRHMTSFGSARALYHVAPADTAASGGRKGVNYSRGRRIDIATVSSKIQTVDVVGQVDGVYIEPLPPAADTSKARSDSTGAPPADTTRAARADTTRVPAADTTAHPAPPPPRRPARKPGP